MRDISVVVPVFNQWHLMADLINAYSRQLGAFSKELVIVDNGSDEIPKLPENPDIIILECKKPGSYAARNKGLSVVSGELVVFTDADCLPESDWLLKLIKSYSDSEKKTLLAGNVIIRGNSQQPSSAELYDMAAGLPQQRYVSRGYAVTANLAIPRTVFDVIGMFDDSRFSGGDADFCQRALSAGFNLKFVSEAVVYHPARTTWGEYATKVRRMKGGQIRAGKLSRRIKYFLITLLPPVWRFWRIVKNDKLKLSEKIRVIWFQSRLWGIELLEMFALIFGKIPERR
ncbi:glycosyltransferase family 2 protein [Methylophaga thiooxydans]|uniref:Glycosyl transferase, group 2 family protein n=1 Tax=Methylophaga thiooxydans DMS010 TaxID=637616 RepID=C0N9X2_9GAMM|nr:glycosyltransferase [Methylophaga thiooxydans]EEF78430.1 glycosyl transferase, group 2 family protein [Methylophaga thiooxydans DMS010]